MAEQQPVDQSIDQIINSLPAWLQATVSEYETAIRSMAQDEFWRLMDWIAQDNDTEAAKMLHSKLTLDQMADRKAGITRITQSLASDRQELRQFGRDVFRTAVGYALKAALASVA